MEKVSPALNLAKIDKEITDFWRKDKTFKKSLEQRKDAEQFLFYDGPPFASGLPHYGHLLVGTVKDIVPRYQTMNGKYVDRRFGWDTHGLPIEMIIEKELALNGRTDILEYGVDKYNEACRAGVLRYVDEWEVVTERLGRWVDFENDYKTMDLDFMESVWWVFKQLWDKNRIYEGTRSMPYSWRLSTPLSNFEAGSNYQNVQDPTVTVRFKIKSENDTYFLAWTTTPWTLPSNFALCLGADIDYVKVKSEEDGQNYILAKELLEQIFAKNPYKVISEHKGSDLVNLEYEPLFPYFIDTKEEAFYSLNDDYVTTSDGTGIVHIAPAHGEDDHRLGIDNDLPIIDPTDAEGNYKSSVKDFAGRNIKEAEKDIIKYLKDNGSLFAQGVIDHPYPFCERSNTPLMHKAIPAWYVKVEDQQDQMGSNNDQIHWVPNHIKGGRFGKWLEQARDWNISRNRFWGNPLPVWRCTNSECEEIICCGSKAELEQLSGKTVTDLHKHFVDKISWDCKCKSGKMERIPEVLDCWFESGSMPYAQLHYPFENKTAFDKSYPADFIIESLDQTRGWFYTLTVLSTAIFDKPAFKNCVVTGMVLAEDGKKMSKSLKNYPDPKDLLDQYGGDALRLYLVNSPLVKGESLRFKEQGVKDTIKEVFLPFWNAYSFFTTYAGNDDYKPSENLLSSENPLDKWIISKFQSLLVNIEREMSVYQIYNVVPALLEFLENLTNWYVRRSRRRFWGSTNTADKQGGYDTLYYILLEFSKALAPFLPFMTESIYLNLQTLQGRSGESIHLTDYPKAKEALKSDVLENQVALIQDTVKLGRALRTRLKLKTRQPLASITVVTKDAADANCLENFADDIIAELNVKEVKFSDQESELVDLTVKPDFPKLGPIFGAEMKNLAKFLSTLSAAEIEKVESGSELEFLGKKIPAEHLQIRRAAKSKDLEIETANGVTVFFDTNITENLKAEGLAREVVNRIQRMRKDADFDIADRIKTIYQVSPEIQSAISTNCDYIKSETLSVTLEAAEDFKDTDYTEELDIDGNKVNFGVTKA